MGAGEEPAAEAPAGNEIVGIWQGKLEVMPGTEMTIVFRISEADAGLTALMDSPDQGATGIPTSSVSYQSKTLVIEVKGIGGRYEGTMQENRTIRGTWSQGGSALDLVLAMVDKPAEPVKRPQEPVEPFPYDATEVEFRNDKAGVKLAGTLTAPKPEGKYPAVVLISGSGAQNRDEMIFGHKPFLVLADHLTRKGIAVLRYDDRGVGGSTGDPSNATSETFAGDVLAAVEFLKTQDKVDPARIGLIGHSEGGIIAPMVATKSRDVSFTVLLGATGVPGTEVLYLQGEKIRRAADQTEEQVQAGRKLQEKLFEIALSDKLESQKRREMTAELKAVVEDGSLGEELSDEAIEAQVSMMVSPWIKFFLGYDPAPALRKVRVPVLAVTGELDLQAPPEQNLPKIEAALARGGNPKYMTVELPKLNHMFQTAETGLVAEYGKIEETFAPNALETVSGWIEDITE
ncbi:MAG: alpha/beta fold hydrolase [candidate division WOR-3 bacterium]|nr:MAG: alpha/beta fold hydrolase [candidate division WOR-3 bacterium]